MAGKEYPYTAGTTSWAGFRIPARPSRFHTSLRPGTFLLPSIFVLAAIVALAVDFQIAQWCAGHRLPRELGKLLSIGETCFHGLGVLVIVIAMSQLDVARRKFIPHVLWASLGAGMAANGIKLMVGRVRPHSFDFHGDVWSSFTGVFPMLGSGSSGQSFPSAHVAVAAGLTLVLSRLYPQAKWFFVVLAVLAGCQRINCRAHYLSDVLVGAAVGMIFASAILSTNTFLIPPAGQASEEI